MMLTRAKPTIPKASVTSTRLNARRKACVPNLKWGLPGIVRDTGRINFMGNGLYGEHSGSGHGGWVTGSQRLSLHYTSEGDWQSESRFHLKHPQAPI